MEDLMKLYKVWTIFCCLLLASALIIGCGSDDDDDDTEADAYDASSILSHYANNVVLTIYTDLDHEAGELLASVKTLIDDTSQSNLESAQEAWVATRIPWERSEAFLFGPVDTQGLDPALDSWPVNREDLQAVLDSDDELTTDSVGGLEDTLKGFHTIEFLLFREGDQRQASDITDRELEYLLASTMNLKNSTSQLANAWASSGENYSNTVASAGAEGNSVYPSQSSGLQELVGGMIVIADEVANGKISDPYNEEDTKLVESQFSFNSIADFQNNIRGIQAVYTGNYNNDGPGLDGFVGESDSELDSRFKSEVQSAIDAIGAIPDPFRDAITENRSSVQNAIDAVSTVHITLEQDILPLIQESEFN